MKKDNTKLLITTSSVLSAILSFILIDFLDSTITGEINGFGIIIYRVIAAVVIGMLLGLSFSALINTKSSNPFPPKSFK